MSQHESLDQEWDCTNLLWPQMNLPALCKHALRNVWRCTGAGGKGHCDGRFPFLCLYTSAGACLASSCCQEAKEQNFLSVRQDWQGRQEAHGCSHVKEKSRGVKVGNPRDSRDKVNSCTTSTKPAMCKPLGEFVIRFVFYLLYHSLHPLDHPRLHTLSFTDFYHYFIEMNIIDLFSTC